MEKAIKLFGDGDVTANQLSALRALGNARSSGGETFMKFASRGDGWSYGAEGIPIEDDELWAVNPNSFNVGVIGWQDGAVVGEEMHSIASGKRVDRSQLQDIPASADPNVNNGWQDQVTVNMRAVADGTEVMFKTTTHGGLSAITELANACATQGEADAAHVVPVVFLKRSSYKHKTRGKMGIPVIEIDHWVDMDGNKPGRAKNKKRNLTG